MDYGDFMDCSEDTNNNDLSSFVNNEANKINEIEVVDQEEDNTFEERKRKLPEHFRALGKETEEDCDDYYDEKFLNFKSMYKIEKIPPFFNVESRFYEKENQNETYEETKEKVRILLRINKKAKREAKETDEQIYFFGEKLKFVFI